MTDITEFTQKVDFGDPFTFVKFGDGEFICMSGKWGRRGANTDHDPYDVKKGKLLEEAYGWYCGSRRTYMGEMRRAHIPIYALGTMDRLHAAYGDPAARPRTVDVNMLYLGVPGYWRGQTQEALDKLRHFYRTLRTSDRAKVFVGPARLAPAAALIRADEHVVAPLTNAFAQCGEILAQLSDLADGTIVVFSVGMLAKILARAVMKREAGPTTCLDLGSAFDSYCGFKTRSYQPSPEETQKFFASVL